MLVFGSIVGSNYLYHMPTRNCWTTVSRSPEVATIRHIEFPYVECRKACCMRDTFFFLWAGLPRPGRADLARLVHLAQAGNGWPSAGFAGRFADLPTKVS